MSRRLSYSEISTAQTCTARWDMSYSDRLAGSSLKSRRIAPILSDGRAWGAGVAAFHADAGNLLGLFSGVEAMRVSVDEDLAFMADAGVLTDATLDQRTATLERLEAMLRHYAELDDPLANLTRLEDEIVVPIPSRTGPRGSSRYQFGAKIDGFTVDHNGDDWLVEFKLRNKLQPRWVIELLRQYRWYAWARQRESGRRVVGILVDERLNVAPRPPKVLKSGQVSTHSRQLTTVNAYVAACESAGHDPDPEMVMTLGQRVWQQRVAIMFRPGELEEAGRELTSAAIDIRDLDNGVKFPTRNASERTCSGCRFRMICNDPYGSLVDDLFLRTVPKRLRDAAPEAVQEQSTTTQEAVL
jgi:hypothetical protein